MTPAAKAPLPPQKGYATWLDYAVKSLYQSTRQLSLDHAWGHQPQWLENVQRGDFEEAAATELAQVRSSTIWDTCPEIECVDGTWGFAGTKVPVSRMFEVMGQGGIMLQELRFNLVPESVSLEQMQAIFAHVARNLGEAKP